MLHQASGLMRISSCSAYTRSIAVTTKFSPGDIVYDCNKANKGKLEKVGIKMILLNQNFGSQHIIYKDMLNGLYNESDLCTHAEAVAAANTYINAQIADIDAYINKLNCP